MMRVEKEVRAKVFLPWENIADYDVRDYAMDAFYDHAENAMDKFMRTFPEAVDDWEMDEIEYIYIHFKSKLNVDYYLEKLEPYLKEEFERCYDEALATAAEDREEEEDDNRWDAHKPIPRPNEPFSNCWRA